MRTGSPHNQLISRCIYSYYDTIIKNSKLTVTQYYNDNKKTVTRYIRERYAEQLFHTMTALVVVGLKANSGADIFEVVLADEIYV